MIRRHPAGVVHVANEKSLLIRRPGAINPVRISLVRREHPPKNGILEKAGLQRARQTGLVEQDQANSGWRVVQEGSEQGELNVR